MGERLVFRRLTLVGPARDYEVSFRDGVNVIAGPVMTGKSSILRLLDYAMGSSRRPEYPEISKCNELLVELQAGGETLTIQRSLRNVSAQAMLYEGTIDSVRADEIKGTAVAPKQTVGQASISSELMRRLGLSELSVKAAPTQNASELSTFSLRDLVSLVFLDQTRISDERSAFFEKEPFKAIKWKAGVEVVHALYDEAAAQLSKGLRDAQSEQQQLERYFDTARQFLDEAQVPASDEIDVELKKLELQRAELDERATRLKESANAEMGDNLALVRHRAEQVDQARTVDARIGEAERTLGQLGRLRVQYDRERSQLEFLRESSRLIGSLPVARCPACLQGVEHLPGETCYVCAKPTRLDDEGISVTVRLRAVRRRIGDLEQYLEQLRATTAALVRQKQDLAASIAESSRALARVEQTSLLPSARVLSEVGETLALVERKRLAYEEQRFLRERARGEGSALLAVGERVRRLEEQLSNLEAGRRDSETVVSALSQQFRDVLENIRFPYLQGLAVDAKTYRPIVRDASYGAVSSKGAISLIVTAWHLALLKYALDVPSLFPMLLMLDSPLSHVGRDESDPDFKDQQIVDAFFGLMRRLHVEHGGEFQLIMCDNHPPENAADLITTEFTGDRTVGRVGLVSDE